MKVALAQMISGADATLNLGVIKNRIKEASEKGAELVIFPENCLLMDSANYATYADLLEQSPSPLDEISELAAKHEIAVILGSVPMYGEDERKVKAVAVAWNKQGEKICRYEKIHLFDARVGDAHGVYRESAFFAPGNKVVMADINGFNVGFSICYDLRFPLLFQNLRLQGADIVIVPAAFTQFTGEAHWEPLLRARAIENQMYVLGINQGGTHTPTRETYGRTMAVDPWGTVVDSLEKGEGLLVVDICKDKILDIRNAMPVFEHRRKL